MPESESVPAPVVRIARPTARCARIIASYSAGGNGGIGGVPLRLSPVSRDISRAYASFGKFASWSSSRASRAASSDVDRRVIVCGKLCFHSLGDLNVIIR